MSRMIVHVQRRLELIREQWQSINLRPKEGCDYWVLYFVKMVGMQGGELVDAVSGLVQFARGALYEDEMQLE